MQEAPKAEQLFSRSASWNRSGNENEIEGSRRSYPGIVIVDVGTLRKSLA